MTWGEIKQNGIFLNSSHNKINKTALLKRSSQGYDFTLTVTSTVKIVYKLSIVLTTVTPRKISDAFYLSPVNALKFKLIQNIENSSSRHLPKTTLEYSATNEIHL